MAYTRQEKLSPKQHITACTANECEWVKMCPATTTVSVLQLNAIRKTKHYLFTYNVPRFRVKIDLIMILTREKIHNFNNKL